MAKAKKTLCKSGKKKGRMVQLTNLRRAGKHLKAEKFYPQNREKSVVRRAKHSQDVKQTIGTKRGGGRPVTFVWGGGGAVSKPREGKGNSDWSWQNVRERESIKKST